MWLPYRGNLIGNNRRQWQQRQGLSMLGIAAKSTKEQSKFSNNFFYLCSLKCSINIYSMAGILIETKAIRYTIKYLIHLSHNLKLYHPYVCTVHTILYINFPSHKLINDISRMCNIYSLWQIIKFYYKSICFHSKFSFCVRYQNSFCKKMPLIYIIRFFSISIDMTHTRRNQIYN